MNIETLNQWGGNFLNCAWPILWQSSLLIAILFAFDFLLRRQLRASIRYAFWLVVLVKLILPPTLALPTSPAWWLHKLAVPVQTKIQAPKYTVTFNQSALPEIPPPTFPVFVPPPPKLTFAAWSLVVSAAVSVLLFAWLLARWWQIARQVRRAKISESLTVLADKAKTRAGMNFKSPPVKLTANTMSPAVCGLMRPTILIPQALAENFSDDQLRAVLLHELIHLRRRDVWVNFLQSLLQIFYWWHPLVWLANARLRRVREEAVDDAVMLALRDDAETYAPTLLEVAKLALNRPLASLGLVGILESRSALRQRIERLVNFTAPRKAGLTIVSLLGILVFSAVAVPMGGAPEQTDSTLSDAPGNLNQTNATPVVGIVSATNVFSPIGRTNESSRQQNNPAPDRLAQSYQLDHPVDEESLKKLFMAAGVQMPPTAFLYPGNGVVLATGTKEQLAQVYRVVLKLNGFAPQEIESIVSQSLREQAIGMGTQPAASNQLFMRSFKIDASFLAALRTTGGGQSTNITLMARSLFTNLGMNLETPKGKAVFYNDRLSVLFVKATESDLDIVERAIQTLSQVAPQNQSASLETGLKISSGNDSNSQPVVGVVRVETNYSTALHALQQRTHVETLDEPKAVTTSGRLAQLRAVNTAQNITLTITPAPQIHIKARFLEVPKGTLADLEAMTNSTGKFFTGILNEKNMELVLRSLGSIKDSKTLAEPECVTTSGRQTQMRATEVVSVITGFAYQASLTNGTSSITPQTAQIETGPILDVVPCVLSDGHTINLTVIPTLTEFWGYATPPAVPNMTGTNNRVQLPAILPQFTTRQFTANLNLGDGQTAVIGGMVETNDVEDKVPVLGSIPLMGRLFRSKTITANEIVVLITATIVDPAGNRVYADHDYYDDIALPYTE